MAIAVLVSAGCSVDYTPSGADAAAGDVVVQGDLLGVADRPITDGVLGAVTVEGVYDFPKAGGVGLAIAAGAICYWDVAEQEAGAEAEAGANKLLGKCVTAAGDSDTTVRIKLDQ